MKNLLSAVAALVLAGCTTLDTSPGYVPAVQVLFTTPETIKMRWHTLRFSEKEAQAMAVAYCKGAQVTVIDAGPPDEFRIKTWRCG